MICSTNSRLAGCLLALLLTVGAAKAQQPAPAPAATATEATPAPAAITPPAATVPAPVTRPAPAAVQPYAGAAAGSLLQTIFALCVVLGLLAVLAWAMKRYGPKAAGGSAHVRMVGGLNLGGRERIIVVEVGEQWIVVGASPGRVNALATMPRQGDAAATLAASTDAQPRPASSFGEWLKQTIDKRNAP
jgi:flagellar protein FliO/FliZ